MGGKAFRWPAGTYVSNDKETVEYILGILITVCKLFGGAILLWGIVCWVMAMKNEDAGSKQKALMATLTGVILFTIKSILQGAGVIV